MKNWIKSAFYIPKHTKPTDTNILRLLLPSVLGVILCMVCLAGMTWAWFTASVQTKPHTIAAAHFDVTVSIADPSGKAVAESADGYHLSAGAAYTVTLTAAGSAEEYGGYCVIKHGESSALYTQQLMPPDGKMTFTFQPAANDAYTFTGVWGRYTGDQQVIEDSDLVEEAQWVSEEQQPGGEEQPGNATAYVVQKGDTLRDIAVEYHTTVEKLAAYNKLENPNYLQIGQIILLPAAPEDAAA